MSTPNVPTPNASSPSAPRWRQVGYWADLGERVAWTAAEVIVASISVDQLGLPGWAVMPATVALAGAKGLVAKHFGRKGTAALAPGQ